MNVLNALQRFAPFKHLAASSAELLSQEAEQRQVAQRAAVLHKGQPASGAYVVISGCLRVFTMNAQGTQATLYFIRQGETCVLALNSLFNNLLYPAWVEAETSSEVAVIPGTTYRKLFQMEPQIQDFTVRSLSTLVYRLMGELEQVHSSHHRQRLAQFILAHADAQGVLRMTQQQLAQHLGTTREVIARLMQGLVAQALVRTARGSLTISDLHGLRQVVWPEMHAQPQR